MSKTFSPYEQDEVTGLLTDLAIKQVAVDAGESEQECLRDERADLVINLKSRGVHRNLLVNATKHPGRPEGLSVEAIDLAAKKRRQALAATNGDD